jgi:hypothetical protein
MKGGKFIMKIMSIIIVAVALVGLSACASKSSCHTKPAPASSGYTK